MKRFESLSHWKSVHHFFNMGIATLAASVLTAVAGPALAQDKKPDFAGHWVLSKTKSDFGGGPKVNSVTEDIQQSGSIIAIKTVTVDARGKQERIVRYTTDGAADTNVVLGHQMKTVSHWDGENLVTVIRDERGLQLTETRSLSKNGKTQTIETDFGMGKQKLVEDKK